MKVKKSCAYCGKELYLSPSVIARRNNIYCSKSCHYKHMTKYNRSEPDSIKRSKHKKFVSEVVVNPDCIVKRFNLSYDLNDKLKLICSSLGITEQKFISKVVTDRLNTFKLTRAVIEKNKERFGN